MRFHPEIIFVRPNEDFSKSLCLVPNFIIEQNFTLIFFDIWFYIRPSEGPSVCLCVCGRRGRVFLITRLLHIAYVPNIIIVKNFTSMGLKSSIIPEIILEMPNEYFSKSPCLVPSFIIGQNFSSMTLIFFDISFYIRSSAGHS